MAEAPATLSTPKHVMQAASAIAEDGRPDQAVALMIESRACWDSTPPDFDITLGRLMLRAGRADEAVTLLQATFERRRADVPPRWHRLLGRALLASGRPRKAGGHLELALADGTAGWTLAELVCVEDHVLRIGRSSPIDRRFIPGFTFADPERGASYLMIPKNACTILKAIFVMNSPVRTRYIESGETIHRFFSAMSREQAGKDRRGHEVPRVVVLRDPLTRLVSAYINKFVRSSELDPDMIKPVQALVARAQRVLGLQRDQDRSITFAEFVRYLATISDAECDPHWLPQCQLMGTDLSLYAHAGRFEHLDATFDYLSTMFRMVIETSIDAHIDAPETHATRYDPDCPVTEAWNATPETLRACENGYPMAEAFYDAPLRDAVLTRYAADAALHARL